MEINLKVDCFTEQTTSRNEDFKCLVGLSPLHGTPTKHFRQAEGIKNHTKVEIVAGIPDLERGGG